MKVVPEKIHITSMRMINGNINCPPDFDFVANKIEGYRFTFQVDTKTNLENKQLWFLFKLNLDAIGSEERMLPVSANYTLEYGTEVENIEEFLIVKEGDETRIHNVLGATLLGIVFSTTRGIVMGRTQGTILEGIILPVIDPHKLLSAEGVKVEMNTAAVVKDLR